MCVVCMSCVHVCCGCNVFCVRHPPWHVTVACAAVTSGMAPLTGPRKQSLNPQERYTLRTCSSSRYLLTDIRLLPAGPDAIVKPFCKAYKRPLSCCNCLPSPKQLWYPWPPLLPRTKKIPMTCLRPCNPLDQR